MIRLVNVNIEVRTNALKPFKDAHSSLKRSTEPVQGPLGGWIVTYMFKGRKGQGDVRWRQDV